MPGRIKLTLLTFPQTIILLLIILFVSVGGYFYVRNQAYQLKSRAVSELTAISELKVNQILAWRIERLSDAGGISLSPFAAPHVREWLAGIASPDIQRKIELWIKSRTTRLPEYSKVYLLDSSGKVRLQFPQKNGRISPELEPEIKRAIRTKEFIFTDFIRDKNTDRISLYLIIPILGAAEKKEIPVGTVLLEIDPQKYIFPLVESWPTVSRSGETLLVRREGEEVLYLNELRRLKGTAMRLRYPLKTDKLPAAMAVRGASGEVEGIDYRRVPVISVIRPIPETGWQLVNKIDAEEVYAPLYERSLPALLFIFTVIVAGGLGIILLQHKKLDEAKDEFVRVVAHEVRSPLAIVREGISQVVDGLHGAIDETQKYLLSSLIGYIDRLTRITNNLLDLSKIESGRIRLKKENFNICSFVREILPAFRLKAGKKGIEIREKICEENIFVYADRDKLFEIFANLIGNALKFSAGGWIEVSAARKGKMVECGVADNGPGISRGNLNLLFRKFAQFGASAGEEKGAGLGLAITRSLVELHGGKIEVKSEEKKGTRFTFTIPLSNRNHSEGDKIAKNSDH